MSALESLGKAIMKRPWAFISAIVVITLIMGYFSTNFNQTTEENAFTPDDEVSRANRKVNEEYGFQTTRLSVLIRSDGNVLSRESLISQVELARKLYSSPSAGTIASSAEDKDGMLYPAEVVVQSMFYTMTVNATKTILADMGMDRPCLEMERLLSTFLSKGTSLDHDEMVGILNGGTVVIDSDCGPISIKFPLYDPKDLPSYSLEAPMGIALDYLLSKEYSPGDTAASKGLFVISIVDELDPEKQLAAEKEWDSIAKESSKDGIRYIVIGDKLISERISEASGRSMGTLFLLALVMIILVLVFVFRDWFEIVINITGLFFAVIWVFGIGGLLGYENNPSLTTVPVLIIALGIDYGIHLTMRYREELRKGKKVKESITAAEASVGFAIVLATVTTLIGFLSNLSATSPGIRTFGVLNAVGILSAFIIMMTFVPAARALREGRKEKMGKPLVKMEKNKSDIWGWASKRADSLGLGSLGLVRPEGPNFLNKFLSSGSSLASRPHVIIPVVFLLTGVGIYGGMQLKAQFDFRDFLPDGLEVTDAVRTTVDSFDFSSEQAYILVEGDVTDPSVFKAIGDVKDMASEGPDIISSQQFGSPLDLGRSLSDPSLPTFNLSFSAIWHSNLDKDYDSVLDGDIKKENISAVYDTLMETRPDQAERLLKKEGAEYTGMVIRVPVNSRGGSKAKEVRDQIVAASGPMKELEGGPLKKVSPTGGALVQQSVLESIAGGQTRSVGVTFLVSLLILTIIFLISKRSLLLGMVTMTPLIIVIAWTTGGMFYFGIPLNVVTVTISAITVGIGIDYGIHISQRFLEDLDRIKDPICALSSAVAHTGNALFGSMMTTVIGFAILSFAIIPPLAQFGQVTAISVLFAFMASVFVLPALLVLWLRGNHWYRRRFKHEDIPKFGKECLEPPMI